MVKLLIGLLGRDISLVDPKVLTFYNYHLNPEDREAFLEKALSRKDAPDCYGCEIGEEYQKKLCSICGLIYESSGSKK